MKNITKPVLKGKRIFLRKITIADVSDNYLKWMNDYEIVKYTESRHIVHTKESLLDFVSTINNERNYCFAIIDIQTGTHIGNIKIGNIHPVYKYGEIGLIVGNKEYWGQGIATEAILLCVDFAFKELELHRLRAGMYELNIASKKSFEKAGFQQEGCEIKKCLFEGRWINSYIYGKINEAIVE
jgi:RimJ/RimL family protein N-acetyltransferase